MTRFLLFFAAVLLCSLPAMAQDEFNPDAGKAGEIVDSPICTYLTNRSDQTIMGTISTMMQTTADGEKVRQRQNYKLAAGERTQICASGPFYEGRRIELVIRTIMPLFDCNTKLDQEIFLDAEPQPSGFKKTDGDLLLGFGWSVRSPVIPAADRVTDL